MCWHLHRRLHTSNLDAKVNIPNFDARFSLLAAAIFVLLIDANWERKHPHEGLPDRYPLNGSAQLEPPWTRWIPHLHGSHSSRSSRHSVRGYRTLEPGVWSALRRIEAGDFKFGSFVRTLAGLSKGSLVQSRKGCIFCTRSVLYRPCFNSVMREAREQYTCVAAFRLQAQVRRALTTSSYCE